MDELDLGASTRLAPPEAAVTSTPVRLTVHLMGGLGNQLFQYAFARRLALANEAELLLDVSGYRDSGSADPTTGQRACELTSFRVIGRVVEADPNTHLPHRAARLGRKVAHLAIRLRDRSVPYYARREIVEPASSYFRFDQRVYDRLFRGSVELRGFWQSEKYFADIESLLRKDLVLRDPLTPQSSDLAATILGSEAVAVHVRHGDNANTVAASLGVLPRDYYECAIDAVVKELGQPRFFLFSDDIPWARTFLQDPRLEFETLHVSTNAPAEDLWLISLCKHHIIANSTFGWWGAWLGRKPEQIVYAPRRYYQNEDVPNPDYYPASWRLI